MKKNIRNLLAGIAGFEIYTVVLLTIGSMLKEALLLAIPVAGLFFTLLRWIIYGRPAPRSYVNAAISLLVMMTLISLWITSQPQVTQIQVLRLLGGIALFYSVQNWASNHRRLGWLYAGFIFAGLILALFALISVQWVGGTLAFLPQSLYLRLAPIVADTANPNVMAGSLVLLLPVLLSYCLFGWKGSENLSGWLVGLTASVMLVVLVLTQSRGGYLALSAAIIMLVVLRWSWGWLILVSGAVAAAATAVVIGPQQLFALVSVNPYLGGIEGRLEVWSRAVYMIQDFPFTGVGMGSFGRVAEILYPFFLFAPDQNMHTHNLFLQVAVDLGIPGFIAWLVIFGFVCQSAWRVYLQWKPGLPGSSWSGALGAGILASQTALVIHGLLDSVVWGMVRPAPLVWAIWGAASAAVLLINHKAAHPS